MPTTERNSRSMINKDVLGALLFNCKRGQTPSMTLDFRPRFGEHAVASYSFCLDILLTAVIAERFILFCGEIYAGQKLVKNSVIF